jgi:hypothetical protein
MATTLPPVICKLLTAHVDRGDVQPLAFNDDLNGDVHADGHYPGVYQRDPKLAAASTASHESVWPESTSAVCHWCCHTFGGAPYGIPVSRAEDRFRVIGNFCSLECAAAQNFDTSKDSETGAERNVYINEMSMLSGNGYARVVPAPSRTVLKMFGGDVDIVGFRRHDNKIRLLYPPRMIVEQLYVEEVDAVQVQREARYVPIHDDKLKRFADKGDTEVKLKRQKPRKGHMPALDSLFCA